MRRPSLWSKRPRALISARFRPAGSRFTPWLKPPSRWFGRRFPRKRQSDARARGSTCNQGAGNPDGEWPVLEEILVVEKRLILREELHIKQEVSHETVEVPVSLRKQRAVVERVDAQGQRITEEKSDDERD